MNTPTSNPFADEPLPTAGERLTSAAHPLNPYAAPASVGTYAAVPPPGVGMWRDGSYLVMHPDVVFPHRCLLTGQETSERHRQQVRWYYPIDYATRILRVEYGLLPERKNRILGQRIGAFLLAVLAAVIAFGAAQSAEFNPAATRVVFWLCVALTVAGIQWCIHGGRLLVFQKVKNSYLWLRGAKQPFLETLPEWPGFNG